MKPSRFGGTAAAVLVFLLLGGCGERAPEPREAPSEEAAAGDEVAEPAPSDLPLERWASAAAERNQLFDRAVVEAVYASPEACRPESEFPPTTTRPRLFPGDAGTLVWLFCDAGAYQEVGALYWVEGERVSRLSLGYVDVEGERQTRALTGLFDFDPTTREAHDFIKYRGLGDCGSWAHYRLASGTLELLEYRERECDDDFAEEDPPPPSQWPRRFP